MLLGQLPHGFQNLPSQLRIQGRGRLIKQHNLWLHSQGSGNSHSLLLTARQSAGISIPLVKKPNLPQKLLCLWTNLLHRTLFYLHRSLQQILHNRHMRKKIKLLKYHACTSQNLPGLGLIHIFCPAISSVFRQGTAHNLDFARVNLLQTIDTPQHGAFARAGRTNNSQYITLGYRKIYALQHLQLPKAFMYIRHF